MHLRVTQDRVWLKLLDEAGRVAAVEDRLRGFRRRILNPSVIAHVRWWARPDSTSHVGTRFGPKISASAKTLMATARGGFKPLVVLILLQVVGDQPWLSKQKDAGC